MKKSGAAFGYLLTLHLFGLLLLTLIRVVLFVQGHAYLDEAHRSVGTILTAFARGVWLDNVVACYVAFLPLAVLTATTLFRPAGERLLKAVRWFFFGCYLLLFAVGTADLPYFSYFFRHINASVFDWLVDDTATTLSMLSEEPDYYGAFFFFLLLGFLFFFGSRRILRFWLRVGHSAPKESAGRRLGMALCGLALTGLCLFGIRGRVGYNPIRVSAAFYCNNPFLNQLGIAPAFNLLRSVVDASKAENREIVLMNEADAERNARGYFSDGFFSDTLFVDSISPVARRMVPLRSRPRRDNVVVILMESMSAGYMGRYGNSENLTPFLDSLSRESLAFDRFFSAGIHTNHGIMATLYSFPALLKRNSMKGAVIQRYTGLPTVLRERGYATLFFMTHESQYDNMNGFLRTNGYDRIYAEENYPPEKAVNSFGVQDDFLFAYAIPVLNEAAAAGTPFLATLLTISNHPPYVVPDWFEPRNEDPARQIVEYADWSLRSFFEAARKEPWFDRTLFVLLGDHGRLVGDVTCEMPLSCNHIPFLLYAPGRIEPDSVQGWGMQVDVAPTVLGWLGEPYVQTGLGQDLLRDPRPAAYFCADDAIGCIDDSLFYIYRPGEERSFLYRLSDGWTLTPEPSDSAAAVPLRRYAFSMLQTAESLIRSERTSLP